MFHRSLKLQSFQSTVLLLEYVLLRQCRRQCSDPNSNWFHGEAAIATLRIGKCSHGTAATLSIFALSSFFPRWILRWTRPTPPQTGTRYTFYCLSVTLCIINYCVIIMRFLYDKISFLCVFHTNYRGLSFIIIISQGREFLFLVDSLFVYKLSTVRLLFHEHPQSLEWAAM